jgi:site-specific DNA recombinase
MRNRPRAEWVVQERPELRIVSDDLWERVQRTRTEVREAVAPKHNLGRGKSGKHHSSHLFSGFAKCSVCGGAMGSVSGGKGSPRLGCRRSWNEGPSACSNRLTIRIKVTEPQILAKLHGELLEPATITYITKAVEREVKRSAGGGPKKTEQVRKRLDHEKRKLQNLVTALEDGSSTPAAILNAIREREKTIAQLEREAEAATVERPVPLVQDLANVVKA